jgi:hypothetical protein
MKKPATRLRRCKRSSQLTMRGLRCQMRKGPHAAEIPKLSKRKSNRACVQPRSTVTTQTSTTRARQPHQPRHARPRRWCGGRLQRGGVALVGVMLSKRFTSRSMSVRRASTSRAGASCWVGDVTWPPRKSLGYHASTHVSIFEMPQRREPKHPAHGETTRARDRCGVFAVQRGVPGPSYRFR